MNAEEIQAALAAAGMPTAYRLFREAVDPPFVVWMETGTNNMFADGKTYKRIRTINVELYTDKKDTAAEEKLETALDGIAPWQKTEETFIESEQLFENVYEFEV